MPNLKKKKEIHRPIGAMVSIRARVGQGYAG